MNTLNMDSLEKSERTPRRSSRLQKMRQCTPEPEKIILGPKAMMKLNKSKQNLEQNVTSLAQMKSPNIIVTPSTPVNSQTRRGRKKKSVAKEENDVDIKNSTDDEGKSNKGSSFKEKRLTKEKAFDDDEISKVAVTKENEIMTVQGVETISDSDQKDKSAKLEAIPIEESTVKNNTYDISSEEKEENITTQLPAAKDPKSIKEEKFNTTPQLMDESIISVPESPPPVTPAVAPTVKDATFSPEVDTSLHDSRPHIDSIDTMLNTTPIQRSKPMRTSTPLAQKLLKRETPKISAPVLSALAKVLSPKVNCNAGKLTEKSFNDTFNGQIKIINPLEKSILKSSRKRSLSVADGESFMQKKVFLNEQPEVMDIDSIDVKMLQSFREEKEISILKQNATSAKRHKRSLSVSDSPSIKSKSKVPNFKAIHEKQFKKMESIADHAQRKAERAMRLFTPSKLLTTLPEVDGKKDSQSGVSSKIPITFNRKPLTKIPSRENLTTINPNRPKAKRLLSVDVPVKASKLQKVNSLSTLTTKDEDDKKKLVPVMKAPANENNLKTKVVINFSKTNATNSKIPLASSSSQTMRKKVEDRREKNASLYKGHALKGGHDSRKKSETMIKGVRLNRRFELQMQHRLGGENSDN